MTRGFAGLTVALAAMPLVAHHSMRAEYDLSKVITIQGVVTKIEWMNPHARFFLDVTDAAGATVNWDVELGPPNTLKREGFMRETVKGGDRISVEAWLARDGSHHAAPQSITLANGTVINCKSCAAGWEPFKVN